MQVKAIRLILFCVVLVLLGNQSLGDPIAVEAARASLDSNSTLEIRAFHLLSANQGWLWLSKQLYATANSGQRWRDITPAGQATMRAVFFLDAQRGWVLLTQSENASIPSYALARTSDGGQTWQSQAVRLFSSDTAGAPTSAIYLHFLNAQTGWLVVKYATSSAFSRGTLFKTSDGGLTWSELSIPVGEPVYFVTEQIGWTAGGASGDQLYRTQDGGRSWSAQSVANSKPAMSRRYRLPKFDSALKGVLPVVAVDAAGTRIEFYQSGDGGKSWQSSLTVPVTADAVAGTQVPLSVLDTQRWVLAVPNRQRLLSVTQQRNVQSVQSADARAGSIAELHMATASDGWAKSSAGRCAPDAQLGKRCAQDVTLLATHDGGRSWQLLNLPKQVQSAAYQPVPFTGQGFDACFAPTAAQMQNWITNSPYRVWNLYLGGDSLYPKCTPLTASFISQLKQQGWQFIPTWVGRQAPCYGYLFPMSYNTTTAYNQGVGEADAALERAYNLGLTNPDGSGAIIYFDLEYFYSSNATTYAACRSAAKAFISGWSGQLRARGSKAGIYAHYKIMEDFAQITNSPDNIWVASYNYSSYSANASVWGIPNVSDSLWTEQQRLRQYTGGHDETWGGVTVNIDSDVIEGAVVGFACYNLNVGANPSEAGSAVVNTNQNCGGGYNPGTTVQVKANPGSGYLFSGWTGDANAQGNPTTLLMDGNKTLTANFSGVTTRIFIPLFGYGGDHLLSVLKTPVRQQPAQKPLSAYPIPR